MTGIQSSCKTTFCRKHLQEYTRINLDELHTRNKEKEAFEAALAEGADIVIGNTNPTAADRARYIPKAKDAGYRIIGVFMQSRVKECIERNQERTGKAKVPSGAIAATSNKLELPDYCEGFDELYFVSIKDGSFAVSEWLILDNNDFDKAGNNK